MMIEVEVPDEEVRLVVLMGDIPCNGLCTEECLGMTQQLFAIMEGWA